MARTISAVRVEIDRAAARPSASIQASATMASDGRRQRGQDRQRRLGHGVGQAGGPEVERDRPEADRDREREGQVGEPEDDRLGGQLAEVAPDPGGRGDRQRAGDDHGPHLADADRRAGPAAARDERDQHAEQAAGRGGQDRGPRVDEGERQRRTRRGSRASPPGRRGACRPAVPTTASPSPTSEPRMRNSRRYAVVATPVSADRRPASGRWRPRRRPRPARPSRPTTVDGADRAAGRRSRGRRRRTRRRRRRAGSSRRDGVGVRAVARPVRGRSRSARSPSGPSARRGGRQDRDGAAERGDEPGGQDLLERVGRAAEADPDQERALSRRHRPIPTRRMSRPVDDRQDRERGQREPGRRGGRRARRPAHRGRGCRTRRRPRASGQERVGRPADQRAGGPDARDRAPRSRAGSRPGPRRRGGRPGPAAPGRRIGEEAATPTQRDDQAEDRGPGVPGGPGHDGPGHDRERDPREGRVHGWSLMGRRCQLRVGGRRAGSRTRRAASSAATPGR